MVCTIADMLDSGAIPKRVVHGDTKLNNILFDVDTKTAIYTGCLVALSSTAVVLKLLAARNETNTSTGSVAIAFLIFQDIAVVILVLLIPMLGDEGGGLGDILWATLRAGIVIGLVVGAVALMPD